MKKLPKEKDKKTWTEVANVDKKELKTMAVWGLDVGLDQLEKDALYLRRLQMGVLLQW